MYCSECGVKASGRFCSNCGHALLMAEANVEPTAPGRDIDWSDLIEYEKLIGVPAVRDRIARAAALSKKQFSGEQFLDFCDKAFGKLIGLPVPLTPIAQFAQSFHARLGIKTGKSRSQFVARPAGVTLVAVLCSLARNGRALRDVHQTADGCLLVAALPSDMFALEGDLVVTVARRAGGTQVDAATHIPGQLFDWGKSTRCLDGLFDDLSAGAAA